MTIFLGQTPESTGLIRHPYSQEFELEATTGVALGALAVGLSIIIIVAFISLWRRVAPPKSKNDKAHGTVSNKASNILHSGMSQSNVEMLMLTILLVLFTSVVLISLINVSNTLENDPWSNRIFRLVQQPGLLSA